MLAVELDKIEGIVTLKPDGELLKKDFVAATKIIDPFIDRIGGLKGLLIHVESFPSWDSFASLIAHLQFIKEHHNKVSRVAIVTNSVIGNFAENIANHFLSAEIKKFQFDELQNARDWLLSSDVT